MSRSSRRLGPVPAGQIRLLSARARMHGHSDGEFVRLRDDDGILWTGSAFREEDGSVRIRLRDSRGRYATGILDDRGLLLRDDSGRTWRGCLE